MFDTATISEIALYYLCRSIAFHEFHFMLVMTSTDADQFNFTTLKFNKYSPQLFRCQRCKSIKLRIPNMNFQTNEMGRNERANWRTCLLFSSLLWFAYRHNTLIDSINEKKKMFPFDWNACGTIKISITSNAKNIAHWNPIRTIVPGAIVYQTSAFISKRKTYF